MMYDVIIIGAGIMGSATAFQLTELGKKCLMIDRFPLLHTNGSSHGESRIIRKSYDEDHFAKLMASAYNLWHAIEQQYNEKFIVTTGGLDFGIENSDAMKKVEQILKQQGLEYELLNNKEIMNRFPAFQLPDDFFGLYQAESGIILASKTLNFFQQKAHKKGLEIVTGEKVSLIKEEQDHLAVSTKSKTFKGKKVIICTGTWINEFFKNYKVAHRTKILPVNFGYWKVHQPELFKAQNFPIFIAWGDKTFYGFGSLEREKFFKVGAHYSYSELNYRTKGISNHIDRQISSDLQSFVTKTFPTAESQNYSIDSCYYTMNDNENFILDVHPDNSNVIFGGGFSGHGFKFAPLIGKILADLALTGTTTYDIRKFKFGNF